MKWLRWIALAIPLIGVAVLLLSVAFSLGETVTLIGAMLVITGLMQNVAFRIWRDIRPDSGIPSDEIAPLPVQSRKRHG